MTSRRVYRFGEADWHVPVARGTDPEQAAEAGRRGARRAFLAQGDAGFHAQVVRMPAGFEAPVHSHDHAEIFMVLEGACTFDGEPMARFDMTVVAAEEPYGFVAGPDGLAFLVVRTGEATFAGAEPNGREPGIPASSEAGPERPGPKGREREAGS